MPPLARLLTFVAVVCSVDGGLHAYLWMRLVRDPGLPAPWDERGVVAAGVLAVLMFAGPLCARLLPRRVAWIVVWPAFVWMGTAFFLFVLLLAGDVGRVGLAVAGLTGAPSAALLTARAVAALAGGLAVAMLGAGMLTALRTPRVRRVPVTLAKLPPALSGYTIAQITDLHVGPTIGRTLVERVVAATNALEADLVVITGDLVDGPVAALREHVAPLAGLRARDGVFFVTGNHEYFSGVAGWLAHLPTLGMRVLRNERVAIRGDGGFDLAGIDDSSGRSAGPGHGADLERALDGRDPARALVLLAHQPRAVLGACERGVDLQLSGHTHGGQMFPWGYLVRLQQPYVSGLHDHRGTQLYVSNGTGYWGPPVRLGAPPEIALVELRAAGA